jgi:LMBR1 domain-containing protein 1
MQKFKAAMRPFKILAGLILFSLASGIWISMLLTVIDKLKNSPCGARCGYILPHIEIFNPINSIFVLASRYFPLDYVLTILLVLDLFVSTVFGISFVGIRFLWVTFFRVRKGRTRPQGLLFTTVILTLSVLAINYALPMIIAPQYGHFGGQVYCTKMVNGSTHADCTDFPQFLAICTESANTKICTPTVVSTFINRVTLNFPFFGAFAFWAQIVFLGIFILTSITSIIKAPKALGADADDDEFAEEEEEEESLLEGSRRRMGAAWEDITARVAPPQGIDSRAEYSGLP